MENTFFSITKSIVVAFALAMILVPLSSASLNAQRKLPARVEVFSYNSSGSNAQEADEVARMVNQYFTDSGRFTMLPPDRSSVDKELDRQKESIYLDGYMVDQGKAIGAQYLVVGHLISAEKGLDYPTVELGVIDVSTGRTVAVELFSASGRKATAIMYATDDAGEILKSDSNYRNDGKAEIVGVIADISIMKKRLEKSVAEFIDEHFPPAFEITAMEEDGNKVISLEVFCAGYEFRKGESFQIIQEIKRKSGGVQKKQIATVKVSEVEGDYAQCKVTKKEQEALFEKKEEEGLVVLHN